MPRKRAYPRKRDEERRIVVSFSLAGEELRLFREALALTECHEPDLAEIRAKANTLAHQAIGAFIKQKIEIEGAIIV